MNGVFPVICSYCSITILESSRWLQPRTEGKRTSPPLCHTHTLFPTPTFHFWINHGAERGAQELLCTWDSLCALAQWYLCQIVRCVACGYTRVIPDRKQNKALAMWGEKRHLCASLSLGVLRHSWVASQCYRGTPGERRFSSSCPRLESLMPRTGKWTH